MDPRNMDPRTLRSPMPGDISEEEEENELDQLISSFYIEPENFKVRPPQNAEEDSSDGEKKSRRVTIAENRESFEITPAPSRHTMETTQQYNRYKEKDRRSRYSMFISGIEQFDPYQELTAMQIAAFRQVFDMVDKDGGGSIDAEELYNSMKDLEANLNLEEIKEILGELDRDGNGEIDFEEFLYMMTSMSIQIKGKENLYIRY